MIYSKEMLIYHLEALPLELPHNTVNITTCHTSTNQKITANVIMNLQLETGQMIGSSALAENNQHQHKTFYKTSQDRNSQENATGYMSSPHAEIRTPT